MTGTIQSYPNSLLAKRVEGKQNQKQIHSSRMLSHASNVRFQGIIPKVVADKGSDVLVPVFAKIVEVFLWAFLAQDVVAMWVPRIRQSLVRGQIEYDPTKDPDNHGKTPWEIFKKTVHKTISGWNWGGFYEESGREFASGPGVLLIPTLLFAWARHAYGKSAVELGYGPLTKLMDTFSHHLNSSGLNQESTLVTPEAYQAQFKQFLENCFDFDTVDSKLKTLKFTIPESALTYSEPPKFLERLKGWFGKHLGIQSNVTKPTSVNSLGLHGGETTLTELLKNWSSLMTNEIFNQSGRTSEEQAQMINALNHYLNEAITNGFNPKYRTYEQLYHKGFVPLKLLNRHYEGNALKLIPETTFHSLEEFLHEVHKFSDFAKLVIQEKLAGGKAGAGVKDALPKLMTLMYEKLVARKWALAVVSTLSAGFYMVWLAHRMQSHDTYVSNRLLQEKPPVPSMTGKEEKSKANEQSHHSAHTALTFGQMKQKSSRFNGGLFS